MSLPSWYHEAQRKWEAKEQAIRRAAHNAVLTRDADSIIGWRDLGMEFSCIPDPMYPWDPAVVKAIREFDPTFIPVWIRWVFMKPLDEAGSYQTVVYGRHALGRVVKNPHGTLEPFPVEMPSMPCQGIWFSRPNMIERFWMGPQQGELPGCYLPFDWSLWKFCRESYLETSAKKLKELTVDATKDTKERREAATQDELAYRSRDLEKFVQKKLDQVSEVDIKEHLLGDRVKSAKPFVDLAPKPSSWSTQLLEN